MARSFGHLFKFSNWSMRWKISVIPFMSVVFILIGLMFLMPYINGKLIDEKRKALHSVVNAAYNLIDEYDRRAQKGEFTLEEAKQRAKERIRNMPYGENNKDYLWINDMHPTMIMHPVKPELEGKDLSDYADPTGKHLFVEMVKACNDKGEGFVDYMWPKPGESTPVPKVSYVRLYKKWGWVLGTGIYRDDINMILRNILWSTIVFMVCISVANILVAFFITGRITAPLKKSISMADMIAHGDLSCDDLNIKSADEVGILAEALNNMKKSLRKILGNLSDTSNLLASSSEAFSATVERQGTISVGQTAAVSEITSTMEEFSASSTQIADRAQEVVDIASKTWENTKRGAEAVESVLMKMNEISTDSKNSIHEIVELGRQSREITKVMEIINTIADQTKLIAFNAALEASSAGEAGKRFGVVAVEIRRLADSVMESTGEIESKINEILEAINRLVIVSERGAKGINEGMEHSNHTAGILTGIVDDAQATTEAARQISLSTQHQKTASNQVVVALREIMSGAGETSESVGRIHSISNELIELSDKLRVMVEKFKLKNQKSS